MTDLERLEALDALTGSVGWQVVLEQISRREAGALGELLHEKPQAHREVSAARVRELRWVQDWPGLEAQALRKRLEDS